MMSDSKDIELVYDRQCPICDYYCQRMDVDESAGKLKRIDAREDSDLMQEITDTGLDIDEGMVLKLDNRIFYGSDAIHKLATLSSRKGAVNKIAYWVFRWPRVARLLYPLLAACRNVLLRILGRRRINNLSIENNDRF
jgi:predicted DCC family thiol-disulfide oxidoreductase YuxK